MEQSLCHIWGGDVLSVGIAQVWAEVQKVETKGTNVYQISSTGKRWANQSTQLQTHTILYERRKPGSEITSNRAEPQRIVLMSLVLMECVQFGFIIS